jgi:predicted ArsR family transcriptional regulator
MDVHETLAEHDALDRNASDKLVVLGLAEVGETTRQRLASHLGMPYMTVWRAVRGLEADDVVEIRKRALYGLKNPRAQDGIQLAADVAEPPVWKRAEA